MSAFFSKKKLFPLYAATLTALLYLLILCFSNILGYGNLTILCSDLFSQYTAFIQLFLGVLKGNGNFWYSFSVYFGSPTAAVYAYYCLSPFNLLYLIPGISVSAMTIILICLKLSLAAATFQFFVQRGLKNTSPFTILFGTAYALCTFSVTMQIHIMWLDALYILPILILCILRAVKYNKYIPLPIVYAYLFFTNFYMGYIIGVFSALLFLAMLIYFTPSATKNALVMAAKKALLYAGTVLLGAGCCAAILLPCAIQLLSARTASASSFQLVNATVLDIINNLFLGEMQGLGSPFPLIYCSLPALLMLPVYFTASKIQRKEKILVILVLFFYLCGSLFLPVYQFLHALEAPNWYGHRYAFCIVFLLLAICCRAHSGLSKIVPQKGMIYCAGLLIFYAIMISFQSLRFEGSYSVNTHEWWVINAFFLIAYIALFFAFKQKKKLTVVSHLFTLFFCLELVLNGTYCISHNNFGFLSEDYVESWIKGDSGVISTLKSSDPSFYRIRVTNECNFNASSYYHFPGLNTFSTTDAPKLRDTLSKLGIGTSYMTIYDHGYTAPMDRLFSVKYAIDSANEQILGSKDSLPIAFMVSPDFLSWRPINDVFINQENIYSSMTGSSYHFFRSIPLSEVDTEKKNMEILAFDTGYGFQHESDIAANGILTFRFPEHKGETVLAYFTPQGVPGLDETTPEAVSAASGFEKAFRLSDGTIITSITDPETDIPEIKVNFYAGANYDYFVRNIIFYSYSADELSAACENLNAQKCTLTDWKDGDVQFVITASEDRPVLFTSIPYENGWEAYVDGIPAKVGVSMNGTFLALALTPGEHNVRLIFEQPHRFTGVSISAISLLIFLLLFVRNSQAKTASSVKHSEPEVAENK